MRLSPAIWIGPSPLVGHRRCEITADVMHTRNGEQLDLTYLPPLRPETVTTVHIV